MCSCFQFNSLLNFTSVRSFVRWYSLLLQYSISVFFVIFSLNSYLVTLFLFFVIKWSPARTPSSLRWWKLGNVCTCSFACQGKSTHDVNDRNSIRKKQIHQKSFQHLRLRLQIHSLPLLSWFDGAWPTTFLLIFFESKNAAKKLKWTLLVFFVFVPALWNHTRLQQLNVNLLSIKYTVSGFELTIPWSRVPYSNY